MSKRRQWFASAALFLFLFIIDDDVQPLIAAEEKAVVDILRNKVIPREKYYVVPNVGEGWLKPGMMNGTLNVMLSEEVRSTFGYPVLFSPDGETYISEIPIFESDNLTVRFATGNKNGVWMPDGAGYVKVDIIDKLPSQSWFRFVKAGISNRYKFVFCTARAACVDVGITGKDDKSWLSLLYEKPFVFFFIPTSPPGLPRPK